MDLIVRGRLVREGRVRQGDVGILDGRIVRVGTGLEGASVLDAGDLLVLPGGVDAHVHFRDPGHPEKEDWRSGSTAAAFGGVTTVLDMPNTSPPTITRPAFEDKLARAQANSLVDFGLFAGLAGGESIDLLEQATAIKTYLGASTGPLLTRDPDLVARAVAKAAGLGKVAAFHAEDEACLQHHRAAEANADPQDYEAHSRARPAKCEAESIQFLRDLPRPPGARVHVCHLSSAAGLQAMAGTGFTSEVTPHHLLLDTKALGELAGRGMMNPPLRADADRDALRQALRGGRIDCLASDHAPHLPEEKAKGVGEAPAGVPGVETLIPLVMAEVASGRLDAGLVARASAESPARIYGLPKGRIEAGYDADLAFYDLSKVERVHAERLHSKAGWTPFEGFPAVFPRHVLLRGRWLLKDGALADERPGGRFLPGGER